MAFFPRPSFARGWMPDADASGGPADALLRGDNLTLDQLGVLALRQGSTPIGAALSNLDVHSLYTAVLSLTRYRMVGAGAEVFANGSVIAAMLGTGDTAFGSHQGQILFARGASTKKYDGTTVRNWGLAMTGEAPTIAALTPDGKTFATCDSTEVPTWVVNEGTSAVSYDTGQDGTLLGASVVTPVAATGRATMTKDVSATVDPVNFTIYDGGTVGTDDDLLSLYIYIPEPASLSAVDLMIDVNNGTFQEDYYFGSFVSTEDTVLAGDATATTDVDQTGVIPPGHRGAGSPVVGVAVSRTRNDKPVANVGWTKLAIRRRQMVRVGTTAQKDWTTVKAVRLIFTTTATMAIRVDTIRISSGGIFGRYQWAYLLAFNSGTYVGRSALSPLSPETQMTAGSTITLPADAARDGQANEIWLYRRGGALDTLYRTQVYTGAIGTAAIPLTDLLSDADTLIANLKADLDNTTPPADIIGIEGPYFDRTFVLTSAGMLWPSRRLNPDSFATGQAVRIAAQEETPYWVKKGFGGLFLGTSKDIYRLSGDGAELPDGTINFTKTPLNVDHPPINAGLAQEGNLLVYVASDGWRAFGGSGTTPLVGPTSLLYRGLTRHGVSPVNLGSGRFRAAIAKGQLVATAPEGGVASSGVLYRHVPTVNAWYRHTYTPTFQVVYVEPDGTLLAGDTAGLVWQLDTGTTDNGASIPVVLWTKADDHGLAFARKEVTDLHLNLDTGGATVGVTLCADGADTGTVLATSSTSLALRILDARAVGRARQVQLRLTGACTAFRFGGYGVTAVPRPMGVLAYDSGPIDLGSRELVWVRHLFVKVNASADLAITVYMDAAVRASLTVPVPAGNQDLTIPVDVGRGCAGRQPRLVITSAGEFLPYWVDVVLRPSGKGFDKSSVRVAITVGSGAAA